LTERKIIQRIEIKISLPLTILVMPGPPLEFIPYLIWDGGDNSGRYRKEELTSFAKLAFDPDIAAVGVNEFF
jgi:hypothetical protein